MNISQGVKVFRSSNNYPTIIAYKNVGISILTLIFRSSHYYIINISFSELLDIIPINSIALPIDLPLFNGKSNIIKIWLKLIKEGLENYDPFKITTDLSNKKIKENFRLVPINEGVRCRIDGQFNSN